MRPHNGPVRSAAIRDVAKEVVLVLAAAVGIGAVAAVTKGMPTLPPPAAAAVSCGGEGTPPNAAETRWISQEDAHGLLGDPNTVFVDARSATDFESGHIAGAIHVPMDSGTVSDEQLAQLRGARTIVTYCDTGGGCARSATLAGLLTAAGLPDVRVLQDGIPGWNARAFPAEAGPCKDKGCR